MAIPSQNTRGQRTRTLALLPCVLALSVGACSTAGDEDDAAEGGSAANGSGGGSGFNENDDNGQGSTSGIDNQCTGVNTAADANVDIIFIIDGSGSMQDEIDQVRTNINDSFLTIIGASNLGWNLIMIGARTGEVTNLNSLEICVNSPPAGPNCADNPPQFRHVHCEVQSTDPLTSTAFTYAGDPPSWYANDPNNRFMSLCGKTTLPIPIPGWPDAFGMSWDQKKWGEYLRPQATKVFVVVTDDNSEVSAQEFDDWALNVAQPPGIFGSTQDRKYIFNSIVGAETNDSSATCSGAENNGKVYQQLSSMTGGLVASICAFDWSEMFNSIATDIVTTLGCEYPVPAPPNGETLDPNQVNVLYTPSGSETELIARDTTAGCEEGADGWQWNATEDTILLCGTTCERIKNDPEGDVEIKFGCKTTDVPK